MNEQTGTHTRKSRRIWNFTPTTPIKLAPYWSWPLRPVESILYLLRSWNPVGLRCLFLIGAIVTWAFFTPELARAETVAFGWIAEVWLRNFIILFIVAGGLHLLLWRFGV